MSKISKAKLLSFAKSFKADRIVSDGTVLKCELCDMVIVIDEKHQKGQINQHIKSARHSNLTNRHASTSAQPFINEALVRAETLSQAMKGFEIDLTRSFIQSGIPLKKLNSPPLKAFLEKYTKRHIPDESTLCKNYIKPVYSDTITKIKSIVGDHPVCFILDETMDVKQRYILNVLVVPLTGKPVKPMLLKMYELEKTNNSTVMQSFNDACTFLWDGKVEYEKVWLVVTDQASYMLLAFSNLKMMYTNLNHVTCLAHSLHRVCESIRAEFDAVNAFVSCMRIVLLKAPARIQIFKEVTNSCALPPDAVVTRWGTWISCAVYYCKNYNKMVEFVNALTDNAAAITKAKKLIESDDLKDELFNVATYGFIGESIDKLQEQGLPKEEQWKIYSEVSQLLDGVSKEKFVASLGRNPDVESFVAEKNLEKRYKTMYAPLVSVDVERSFSQYKLILSDRRQSLMVENIEMLNVVQFNKFLFVD